MGSTILFLLSAFASAILFGPTKGRELHPMAEASVLGVTPMLAGMGARGTSDDTYEDKCTLRFHSIPVPPTDQDPPLSVLPDPIQTLYDLVDAGELIMLYQLDGEYQVTRGRHNYFADTLEEALLKALRLEPPKKKCVRCKQRKAQTLFAKDANRTDGHHHTCLECERPRWRAYAKRHRKKKVARQGGVYGQASRKVVSKGV